jgi:kynurenine formamidase
VTEILMSVDGHTFRVLSGTPTDISLPLDFHGDQPRHFGAPPARARPLEVDGFVGDTRAGGSCNCEVLTLVPHCNGTHTESIGHIAPEPRSVASLATDALIPALLVSVPSCPREHSAEGAGLFSLPDDRLITAAALQEVAESAQHRPQPALVIRTLPNDGEKRFRHYDSGPTPAYLSPEAADLLVSWNVRHLLIDLPSVDRTHDEGRLAAHRRFWGMAPSATGAPGLLRSDATITEMVFVPNQLKDGLYALSLQIAPFVTDAAPSRPLLFPLEAA